MCDAICLSAGQNVNDVGADLCVRPHEIDLESTSHPKYEKGAEWEKGGHTGPPLQKIIQWFKTMTTMAGRPFPANYGNAIFMTIIDMTGF
jgi:hypothetical protein